jgi:hypothetical protein
MFRDFGDRVDKRYVITASRFSKSRNHDKIKLGLKFVLEK